MQILTRRTSEGRDFDLSCSRWVVRALVLFAATSNREDKVGHMSVSIGDLMAAADDAYEPGRTPKRREKASRKKMHAQSALCSKSTAKRGG